MLKKTNPKVFDDVFSVIKLTNGLCAIVDNEDYEWLSKWKWKAKQSAGLWYAVRSAMVNGEEKLIRMHRQVAHTPHNCIGHHKNNFGLDNRKQNIQNVSRQEHDRIHHRI